MSIIPAFEGFGEWTNFSTFIEMKPRSDIASLFVDVPPGFREKSTIGEGEENKKLKYDDIDVVDVTDRTIRIGAPPSAQLLIRREQEARRATKPLEIKKNNRERTVSNGGSGSSCSPKSSSAPSTPTKKHGKKKGKESKSSSSSSASSEPQKFSRFGVTLKGAKINPKSLCSPSWSENNSRLFMCKVQVEPDNLPLVQKTLHRLAVDICKREQLDEFAEKGNPNIQCGRCGLNLLSDEYIMKIGCLPDDDWLSTSQSADFYCRDSCGAACDPNRDGHHQHHNNEKKKATSIDESKVSPDWLPNEKRVMISFANSIVHNSSIIAENVVIDENKMVKCIGCKCQLGKIQKNHADLVSFNHVAAQMTAGPKRSPFLAKNFRSLCTYMSQLILSSCETQSSLKLVIRSLDKSPYLLVWLLDSYVVIANGEMEGLKSEDDEGAILTPYPAVKLLYKVFNNSTANSDPRANGEDTSVGLVDVALPCVEMLIQLLLRSSHRLPPACRAVGQFFVGYMQIDDHI